MGRKPFRILAFNSPSEMVFGKSKKKLEYGFGFKVGEGEVQPEIKYFPRARMLETPEKTLDAYRNITLRILKKAVRLGMTSVQLETELPAMITSDRELAYTVISEQKALLEKFHEECGLNTALRVTVADIRNFSDPKKFEKDYGILLEAFEASVDAGADVLSIESFGGKEVFSQALARGDIAGIIFSTGVLASLDVERLWCDIVKEFKGKVLLGGDSGCAHANSAMMLAGGFDRRLVSHVLAALVRVAATVRTLVAFECGATGPGKDCAYENVIIKAITGAPISILGKSSACAHSSLIGNITMSVCDLWSNESVEDIKLFGGYAPEVFLEILYYDTLFLNTALKVGKEKEVKGILVDSELYRDPQTFILAPENAFVVAKNIIREVDYLRRTINAVKTALLLIESNSEKLKLPEIELKTIRRLKTKIKEIEKWNDVPESLIEKYRKLARGFNPKLYGL
ncbi:MAG: hypothetical protein J7L38_02585 [Thermoproteales archaeon]|nr:hypothetical protein [Thermoproteales archaeon]